MTTYDHKAHTIRVDDGKPSDRTLDDYRNDGFTVNRGAA